PIQYFLPYTTIFRSNRLSYKPLIETNSNYTSWFNIDQIACSRPLYLLIKLLRKTLKGRQCNSNQLTVSRIEAREGILQAPTALFHLHLASLKDFIDRKELGDAGIIRMRISHQKASFDQCTAHTRNRIRTQSKPSGNSPSPNPWVRDDIAHNFLLRVGQCFLFPRAILSHSSRLQPTRASTSKRPPKLNHDSR